MSLSRKSLSPTANLLRNSRLFSLPNPLPRPPASVQFQDGAGMIKESDTATRPFPTHQAIATTPQSAARGDWGLKRPLPLRSRMLQNSNPVVRINALDTIEHITDYDSATDHVRTRQKFEELGIPVLKGIGTFKDVDPTALYPKSSFESRADTTTYETDKGLDDAGTYLRELRRAIESRAKDRARQMLEYENEKARAIKSGQSIPDPPAEPQFRPFTPPKQDALRFSNSRWKHDGPWLPGMSADEFTNYLSRQVSARAAEFNQFLEEYIKGEIYIRRRSTAMNDHNVPLDPVEAEAYLTEQETKWSNIPPGEIKSAIRSLRIKCAADPLNSVLVNKLIIPFLQLPPMEVKNTRYDAKRAVHAGEAYRFSDDTMPQTTHPSAGLSYLRSTAFLSNHPILGPQAAHPPVPARVIQARVTRTSTEVTAKLGVAGFVANDEYRLVSAANNSKQNMGDVQYLDFNTPGGKKLPVHAHYAAVTPDGRILIKVSRAHGPEVAVARGEFEDAPPVQSHWSWKQSGLAKSKVSELQDVLQTETENDVLKNIVALNNMQSQTRQKD